MDFNQVANNIKKREQPKDVFYTPEPLVRTHLEYISKYVKENDIIFDGFFGLGAYYNLFNEYFKKNTFDFTEIAMNKDFFLYDKKVDVIVSNPPYSLIDKVFEKSVLLNPHTISYLVGVHNLTTKRIMYMNTNGYYLVELKMLKVYKWFGMSCIIVFRKDGKNCIDFDRTVYK